MNYEEALAVLTDNRVSESSVLETDEANAIDKATQAIRDCLEMGLDGEGD